MKSEEEYSNVGLRFPPPNLHFCPSTGSGTPLSFVLCPLFSNDQ